jgi:hypothetical protein
MDFPLYLTNRRRFYNVLEYSEMGSSDKEEIDSDVDTVLADIAKWSDPFRLI